MVQLELATNLNTERVQHLPGGTVNFTQRHFLRQPLTISSNGNGDDSADTIIVKHYEDHLAINAKVPIDISRYVRFAPRFTATKQLLI
jgi:hypothetical protein